MFHSPTQAKAWFKSAAIHWLACASAPLAFGADATNAVVPPSFHRLFSDHRVLQREVAVPVYGHATPGSRLSVRLAGVTQETTVAADGTWQVELPPFPSGGPHRLEAVCNGQVAAVEDILFGDVWIASGQSNMEWKVGGGVLDKEQEIASANFPKIRFFNVPSRLSDVPETDLADGRWQVASPETVSDCSAVAWFFARSVFQETGVPIGIIGCAVGGTPVEAWMSATAMQRFPNPKQAMLDELNAKYGSWTKCIEENQRNIQQLVDQVNSSMQAVAAGVLRADFDDSAWTDGILLADPPPKNCLRWWRRKITLTADQAASPLVLSLARPDAKALVFVNGNKVADVASSDCRVELPAGTFQTGENLIVVRLGNYWGVPRVVGDAAQVFLGTPDGSVSLPVLEGWRYSDTMEPPLTKWLPMGDIPCSLFNGMLHPLLRSPIKGAIWYQGESNVGDAAGYALKFPLMIADWRIHFRQGYFPFYFVQLANFGVTSELPSQDGWPLLREAQAAALHVPNTGMATAIDVGDPLDIHPHDKKSVGHRLALQALAATYGKSTEANGPTYRKIETIQGNLIVHFDHAEGLTPASGETIKGFSIAGTDRRFHLAKAVIREQTLVLSSDQVPAPVAVRYAFSASPVANLKNGAGLPAVPFRSDSWTEIPTAP